MQLQPSSATVSSVTACCTVICKHSSSNKHVILCAVCGCASIHKIALERVTQSRTSIIIAHRLSTVRSMADKVYSMLYSTF
jgi:hypothetical protein